MDCGKSCQLLSLLKPAFMATAGRDAASSSTKSTLGEGGVCVIRNVFCTVDLSEVMNVLFEYDMSFLNVTEEGC